MFLLTAMMCAAGLGALGASSAHGDAGIKEFSLDRSSAQAGAHPEVVLFARFVTKDSELEEAWNDPTVVPHPCLCVDPRRVEFHLPTGFIGNPHAVPQCTLAELATLECPPASQVGLASALFGQQFLYNMEPRPGEPGLTANVIPVFNTPVFAVLSGRTDSDYGLDVVTPDVFHLAGLATLEIRLWGVPADSTHDIYRAPRDHQNACGATYPASCFKMPTPASWPLAPYLMNPTACEGPLTSSVDVEYYNGETAHADDAWAPTVGCSLLGFNPSFAANPTSQQADAPSGIDVELKIPQLQSPTVPSPSQIRATSIRLPEGFSVNPNAADGKTVCTDVEAAFGTLAAAQCPEPSKIGTLSIDNSALPGPISGAMYLGEPKPGDRYRLVMVADGYETHVKLPGSVHLDPQTGRVEVRFDDLPQTPLQRFDMHIFGAERGLLATPERCGRYVGEAEFVPYAAVLGAQSSPVTFTVDSGPGGAPCPGASRPLNPSLTAGSSDNTAGAHSPFALKVGREDGDQNLAGLTVVTPAGFLASLKGVPYCPEDAIARLADPARSGRSEQANPACPAASEVGSAQTAAGAGSRPLSTSGKVYLAGPYKGAHISLVIVVPAVSGPYDLGTVAVRVATHVHPVTAQLTTVSDPIPQILEGIPLRLRTVHVDLDRPNFTLNPTNCNPFSVGLGILGDEGGLASPSAFYQVANCAVLNFSPELDLKLRGSTKRRGHPAVQATLRAARGEANIRSAVVVMPKTLQ
ncbi:MAG TPA: hypothetical protein VK390_00350, partial [Propionibacteriaceae bacterium]|nr:hypothetical protein [Propionibacteriaceae bacterium]